MAWTMMAAWSSPEEQAAWAGLEAAEVLLETALLRRPSAVALIGGLAYYLDESHRLVMAPAFVDGTPDRFNARHRSEYEPMAAEDMVEMTAGIHEWLTAQASSRRP